MILSHVWLQQIALPLTVVRWPHVSRASVNLRSESAQVGNSRKFDTCLTYVLGIQSQADADAYNACFPATPRCTYTAPIAPKAPEPAGSISPGAPTVLQPAPAGMFSQLIAKFVFTKL